MIPAHKALGSLQMRWDGTKKCERADNQRVFFFLSVEFIETKGMGREERTGETERLRQREKERGIEGDGKATSSERMAERSSKSFL